jgi:5-methylcytosine-specific restriction endonuclease McrA
MVKKRTFSKEPDLTALAAKLIRKADTRGRRAPISPTLRKRVLAAHGNRCAYCGIESKHLELDHVVPVSQGGTTTEDNLVPACRACNLCKGKKLYEEWQERIGNRG